MSTVKKNGTRKSARGNFRPQGNKMFAVKLKMSSCEFQAAWLALKRACSQFTDTSLETPGSCIVTP